MNSESYLTIAHPAVSELIIERSRFIGHCETAASENDAKAFVAKIRAEHSQASHNCYAYRIGSGDSPLEYYSDHGEPSGTAGKPILGAIQRLELTHVVVVVTRYFGGKKLGVRGLIEAYGQTATQVLQEAGIVLHVPQFTVLLEYSYSDHNTILYKLGQIGADVLESGFAETVTSTVQIKEEHRPDFDELINSLPGIKATHL